MWLNFFKSLGIKTIVSPKTNREIIKLARANSIDEACFSSKLFISHVKYLMDKCDQIFVPRIENTKIRRDYCARIFGVYDFVINTFPRAKLLHVNINYLYDEAELKAFIEIGATLGKCRDESVKAYYNALATSKLTKKANVLQQEELLACCPHAGGYDLNQEMFYSIFSIIYRATFDRDYLADFIRKNIAFEVNKGDYEKCFNEYLQEVGQVETANEAEIIFEKHRRRIEAIPIDKPDNPIRIGVIGEIYVVIEPSVNCNLERWLAENQVEIHRPTDWSSSTNGAISQAHQMMQDGIDGIIHIKSASCSPEITGMSILQNMSSDYDVPIMFMTFDTTISEAGVHTVEAFYDMVVARKESNEIQHQKKERRAEY